MLFSLALRSVLWPHQLLSYSTIGRPASEKERLGRKPTQARLVEESSHITEIDCSQDAPPLHYGSGITVVGLGGGGGGM